MRAQSTDMRIRPQFEDIICGREDRKKREAGFGTLYSPAVMYEAEETGHGIALDSLQRPVQAAGQVVMKCNCLRRILEQRDRPDGTLSGCVSYISSTILPACDMPLSNQERVGC